MTIHFTDVEHSAAVHAARLEASRRASSSHAALTGQARQAREQSNRAKQLAVRALEAEIGQLLFAEFVKAGVSQDGLAQIEVSARLDHIGHEGLVDEYRLEIGHLGLNANDAEAYQSVVDRVLQVERGFQSWNSQETGDGVHIQSGIAAVLVQPIERAFGVKIAVPPEIVPRPRTDFGL